MIDSEAKTRCKIAPTCTAAQTNIVGPASGQHGVDHQSPCFCHMEMASYAGNQRKYLLPFILL